MDKEFVEMTAVWLRRIGDKVQVLVEFGGEFRLVIEEHFEGNFSHIAEANGYYKWPKDPLKEKP